MGKYNTSISPDEIVRYRNQGNPPKDYHCNCRYCSPESFIGEIYNTEENNYYTQLARYSYYPRPNKNDSKHICPGHWQGYRFAVQYFTSPGDLVYDPTVGSGSGIIEASNNGRFGIGIELEFGEITRRNLDYQTGFNKSNYFFIEGDALNQKSLIPKKYWGKINLVINGTPYPVLSGNKSSDTHQNSFGNKVVPIEYKNEKSLGKKTLSDYYLFVNQLYSDSIDLMKSGGKLIIIIKDLMHKKSPYLLHYYISNEIMSTGKVKYYGWYIHRHIPTTLFMNTYIKRFPEILIPLYQTAIVFEKL